MTDPRRDRICRGSEFYPDRSHMRSNMTKRDYYKVLDVAADRDRGRDQEGLSPPGDEISPGPQSRRQGGRREVQGSQGGLRSPDRRAEARDLRSARPRRARRGARRRRGFSAADAFSDIFGDMFGDIFGGGRRGGARRCSAAPTCATSSSSISSRPCSATSRRSNSPRSANARPAKAAARRRRSQARDLRHLPRRRARCACSRASSSPADLPALQGPRPGHHRALRHLPRPGPRAARRRASR